MVEAPVGEEGLFEQLRAGTLRVMICPTGHGFLPPHRRCPRCGETVESVADVAPEGPVLTHTTIAVPATDFAGDTPIVVIVETGPVRLTARWDEDVPPAVGEHVQLWLGEDPKPHVRAGPMR
jgi:Predicted nucleic-acid-binding protein containing a Zn-ribbon